MRCRRLPTSNPTLGDPRETSGPQIDRIPSTRPSWWRRQYRELKKLFFSPPSKCAIDLFGPVANRAILKQLHVTSRSSSRNPRRRSATPRLESKNLLAPRLQSPIFPDQSPISNQPPAGTPNLQCPMPVLGYIQVPSTQARHSARSSQIITQKNTQHAPTWNG